MTVSIATPFSHLFADATVRGALIRASDLLELRTPAHVSDSEGDVLFHCEFSLVAPWGVRQRDELAKMADKARGRLQLVSFHVLSRYEDNDIVSGAFVGKGTPMSAEQMVANATDNLRYARQVFGAEVGMLVENNNHLGTDAYDTVTDAAFLCRLMDAAGLDLLLDIAHARITAHNTGVAEREYLGGLPLHRVRQVHLSGHGQRADGTYYDAHEPVTESDFDYFAALWGRSLTALEFVTIEYYKDAASLLEQLGVLRALLEGRIND